MYHGMQTLEYDHIQVARRNIICHCGKNAVFPALDVVGKLLLSVFLKLNGRMGLSRFIIIIYDLCLVLYVELADSVWCVGCAYL